MLLVDRRHDRRVGDVGADLDRADAIGAHVVEVRLVGGEPEVVDGDHRGVGLVSARQCTKFEPMKPHAPVTR